MKVKSSLIGHKERCFDVKCCVTTNRDVDGHSKDYASKSYILTGSQDGHAILWDGKTMKSLFKFFHSKNNEVLRVCFLNTSEECLTVAVCGSDGKVNVWQQTVATEGAPKKLNFEIVKTLDHGETQIYACEPVILPLETPLHALITAADSNLFMWNLETTSEDDVPHVMTFSSGSSSVAEDGAGSETKQAFGGPRNPDNLVYIFDAKCNNTIDVAGSANSLCADVLAVALSDSTVRIVDLRSLQETSSVYLSPHGDSDGDDGAEAKASYITSVCWAQAGRLLFAAMGSGHVAIVDAIAGQLLALAEAHGSCCFGVLDVPSAYDIHANEGENDSAPDINGRYVTWSKDMSVRVWRYSISRSSEDATATTGTDASPTKAQDIPDEAAAEACSEGASEYGIDVRLTLTDIAELSNYPVFACNLLPLCGGLSNDLKKRDAGSSILPEGTKAEGTKAEGTKAEGTKAEGTKVEGTKAEGNSRRDTDTHMQARYMITCAGGNSDGASFMGTPVYVLDTPIP